MSPRPQQPLKFTVLGRPQAKGSKKVLPIRSRTRVGERRIVMVDSNKNAAPWETRVAEVALRTATGGETAPLELLNGPVAVKLEFYFSRPRGHYGVGRNINRIRASAPEHITAKPDVDKLARCVLDALTGTLIRDDAQVVVLDLRKQYGEPERLEFRMLAL